MENFELGLDGFKQIINEYVSFLGSSVLGLSITLHTIILEIHLVNEILRGSEFFAMITNSPQIDKNFLRWSWKLSTLNNKNILRWLDFFVKIWNFYSSYLYGAFVSKINILTIICRLLYRLHTSVKINGWKVSVASLTSKGSLVPHETEQLFQIIPLRTYFSTWTGMFFCWTFEVSSFPKPKDFSLI